jgi:hypothetical protein
MSWPNDPLNWTTADLDNIPSLAEWRKVLSAIKAICDTLGIDPQGPAADVATRLSTVSTAVAGIGEGAYQNVRIEPVADGTNWKHQVQITADAIAIEGAWVESVDETVDLAVSGASGLDAGASTEDPDTWYAVWLAYNPAGSGTVKGLFSPSFTRSGLTLDTTLDGYTKFRLVGAQRNGHGGDLLPCTQQDGLALYDLDSDVVYDDDGAMILSAGSASSPTDVDASSLVPPPSRQAWIGGKLITTGSLAGLFVLPGNTVKTVGALLGAGAAAGACFSRTWLGVNDAQHFKYWILGSATANVEVWGYHFPL